ncbi:nucleotidyltransferase domain-containing protein [Halomonas ramblicola]|uniref:nucleotidyltransferase domain-containing protein n=1 Tax=Halomonas ramblicola TaxID=747349 RepID=UPI0025B34EB8|nr:nucleotidyltransferase domain-containing protein [Halomonas ramblicola]MDN3521153.1 nucleotidyltransferase domain-containing protein [Halomonas ramblicola]
MHIYAFGSICRGDISVDSDIDLLALVEGRDSRINPDKFSIYSYARIRELWELGNAFAWHLSLESRLVYSADGSDFLKSLGEPSNYTEGAADCSKFRNIFDSSFRSIKKGSPSLVFELSTIFLALRNISTCYSLARMNIPTFGRDSARRLGPRSLNIDDDVYYLLMQARLLSTRGVGESVSEIDLTVVIPELERCRSWIDEICHEVNIDG